MATEVFFTMTAHVHDHEAFVIAARKRAVENGIDEIDAANTYTEDDIAACAIVLFDPSSSIPGCEIVDSICNEREIGDEE